MTEGDVYRLFDDLGDIPAGGWAVSEIGMMITFVRLGTNEDGALCTTATKVKVTRDELEQFVRMEQRVELLGRIS